MGYCGTCGFASCRCGGFTQHTPETSAHTLLACITPCVDQARDVATCLGLRPYQVHLVRTRWTSGERGAGVEEVLSVEPILPTPKLAKVRVDKRAEGLGWVETGDLLVTEISPRYREEQFYGHSEDGRPIEDGDSFYWEVTQMRPGTPARKRRYTLSSTPELVAERAEWRLQLTRALGDRAADGEVEL